MTKILRFIIKDGVLLSSSITDVSGLPVDLDAGEIPQELEALNLSAAPALDEVAKLQTALAEHQAISDELATRAAAAMASGDIEALPGIIADAKLYGNAREKAKLEAAAAAKTAEAAALTAQAAAL